MFQQSAKSWELRTATSYARLLRDQGRTGEAYNLLAPPVTAGSSRRSCLASTMHTGWRLTCTAIRKFTAAA